MVELLVLLHVHRYSVDIFSYSSRLGILDSYEKQITVYQLPLILSALLHYAWQVLSISEALPEGVPVPLFP